MSRTTLSILCTLALGAGLLACGNESGEGAAADAPAQTDAAYALGLMAERSLEQMQLSPAEREEFDRGMRDYRSGTPRVPLVGEVQRIQSFQMARMNSAMQVELGKGEEFLNQAAAEPGAEKLESGIVFRSLETGEGATPGQGDRALVRGEGTLRDGLVFFSSQQQGRPFAVVMSTGIPCLTEPLARMKVGGKARVTCPSHAGYAVQDKPVLIPPGAALRFELELVDVKPFAGRGHGG